MAGVAETVFVRGDGMSNFRVGQKVVCIKNTVHRVNDLGFPGFVKGQILTVSDVFLSDAYGALPSEEVFLKFVETDHRQCGHHSGFRPVQTRKTDISIFKAMLNPQKQEQNA
jgi:hypothetical protein